MVRPRRRAYFTSSEVVRPPLVRRHSLAAWSAAESLARPGLFPEQSRRDEPHRDHAGESPRTKHTSFLPFEKRPLCPSDESERERGRGCTLTKVAGSRGLRSSGGRGPDVRPLSSRLGVGLSGVTAEIGNHKYQRKLTAFQEPRNDHWKLQRLHMPLAGEGTTEVSRGPRCYQKSDGLGT